MMSLKRSLRPLAAILFMTALGSSGARAAEVVRVAVAVPLTGDLGTEGQGIRRAVELALEEANASGKFPYTLELKALDDRADPKEAVNVANLIISDPKVIAVIGPYNSGCAIPAAKVYARKGVPMISPAATNPEVTAQQLKKSWRGSKIVFRVVPTDDVQGSYAADYVYNKLKLRRISVVHDKTAYGQGLAEEFAKGFKKLGGTVLSFDGISIGDKDFKALLTRLRQGGPEGIYFGGVYTEAGLLVKQARELGMKEPFISGDGAKTDSLFDVAGSAADGAFLTITGVPVEILPAAKEFIGRYKKRFTKADQQLKPFDHFGYEATQILLVALQAAGPDRGKVVDALRRTNYQGMLGTTVFDQKGDTQNKIITMTRANFAKRSFDPLQ